MCRLWQQRWGLPGGHWTGVLKPPPVIAYWTKYNPAGCHGQPLCFRKRTCRSSTSFIAPVFAARNICGWHSKKRSTDHRANFAIIGRSILKLPSAGHLESRHSVLSCFRWNGIRGRPGVAVLCGLLFHNIFRFASLLAFNNNLTEVLIE